MRLLFLVVAACGLMFFGTGCQAPKSAMEFGVISNEENEDVEALARQYGEDLLNGIKNKDYDLFIKHFSDEVKKTATEDKFLNDSKLLDAAGQQLEAVYLGYLRDNQIMRSYLWKVAFEKKIVNKETKEESTVVYDKLFRVIVGKTDGKYQILAFGF